MKARLAAIAAGLSTTVAAVAASAEPMDPAIERLVVNSGACHDQQGVATGVRCYQDDAAFKRLISEYGFAFAANPTFPARTTGYGGFHIAIEAAYTSIDKNADYWRRGTQGTRDPSTNAASVENTGPASVLQLYSVKLRKSFGFGFEIAGMVGFMAQTSLLSGGADVRLSLLEGFRTDIPGYLPDIAVGGGVRTLTGTPQFQLTVASLDTQISKPFPIADSSIITPYIGYQYVWIFGDSGLVDLTPATDPVGYCNFTGPNVPGNADPSETTPEYDGQPVCNGGSTEDFNNNRVFDQARLERQRLLLGLNYQYEPVILGVLFITDIIDPGDAQTGNNRTHMLDADGSAADPEWIDDTVLLQDEPRQWTFVVQVGTIF